MIKTSSGILGSAPDLKRETTICVWPNHDANNKGVLYKY